MVISLIISLIDVAVFPLWKIVIVSNIVIQKIAIFIADERIPPAKVLNSLIFIKSKTTD